MAQTNRPKHYAMALAILAGLLLFTWITLTIRVFYWGSSIVLEWGIGSTEMFTYSAVWLLFGFGLFGLGVWQQNRLLRLISGADRLPGHRQGVPAGYVQSGGHIARTVFHRAWPVTRRRRPVLSAHTQCRCDQGGDQAAHH